MRGVQLPQVLPGDMDVAFSVRHRPSDATIRASRPEILALHLPAVPPETLWMFEQVLLRATREAVAELVLYRVGPREVAIVKTMGFEPGELTVVEDGLVVHFVSRQSTRVNPGQPDTQHRSIHGPSSSCLN